MSSDDSINSEDELTSTQEDDAIATVLSMAAGYYGDTYFDREPCRTSALTGHAWIQELRQGNATRIFENLRVTTEVFDAFCDELSEHIDASRWSRVEVEERAGIFLYTIAKGASNRDLQERFQRSGETIHRHFHSILEIVCSLKSKYIVLPSTPSTVWAANPKYAGVFDECRLAFDGTHIAAFVPAERARPYRDRNGQLSQNVFAACTFDMRFAFVLAGFEGSAADSTVLKFARAHGFSTPRGQFDLGDAGYGLALDVMTPYRGVRYHLREFAQGNQRPQNYKELYNLRHAQARNVIERIFGVLKKRFPILVLETGPQYSLQTQAKIVIACCVMHNFIKMHSELPDDPDSELEDSEVEIDSSDEDGAPSAADAAPADLPPNEDDAQQATYAAAKAKRDRIANLMWDSYVAHRAAHN